MQKLIADLANNDWSEAAGQIYATLKPQIQGPRGVLRKVRDLSEQIRLDSIASEKTKFLILRDVKDLDYKINDFLKSLLNINYKCQQGIYYDLIPMLRNIGGKLDLVPEVREAVDFLSDPMSKGTLQAYRLNMIIGRIANESAGQSNKSNAGNAGEDMVVAALNAAGLRENVDFRKQFKSSKGSDTDFVLPAVNDYEDHNVEVFIAAQLSTNDRARLASSELKKGGQQYLVTGNGMDVSSKDLSAIGSQILEGYRQDNIRLVCYAPEIRKEIQRVKEIQERSGPSEEVALRLRYLGTHAISFEDFATRLKERFGAGSASVS